MNVDIRLASERDAIILARLRYELRASSHQVVEDPFYDKEWKMSFSWKASGSLSSIRKARFKGSGSSSIWNIFWSNCRSELE